MDLHRFLHARLADLATAQNYALQVWQDRSLPDADDLTKGAILNTVAAILLANVMLMLLNARVRKVVLDTLETIVATLLLVALVGIVLGLPLGIFYLIFKALLFLGKTVLGAPVVARLVGAARNLLG